MDLFILLLLIMFICCLMAEVGVEARGQGITVTGVIMTWWHKVGSLDLWVLSSVPRHSRSHCQFSVANVRLSVCLSVCPSAKPLNSLKSSSFIILHSSFIIVHPSFIILHHPSPSFLHFATFKLFSLLTNFCSFSIFSCENDSAIAGVCLSVCLSQVLIKNISIETCSYLANIGIGYCGHANFTPSVYWSWYLMFKVVHKLYKLHYPYGGGGEG